MTISQSTTIQAYQLRKGGTPARMAILRMIAADSANNRNPSTRLQPNDWRAARRYTLCNYAAAYCAGINRGADHWYSHMGEQFRNERDADACNGGPDHSGWFTDSEGYDKAVGIVASLPHGKFIAGCRWTANDERVYFDEVFTDESEAACMADEHARVFADSAREDSVRYEAMCDAEDTAEEKRNAARLAIMARNVSEEHREMAREALAELRTALEALSEATEAYENA